MPGLSSFAKGFGNILNLPSWNESSRQDFSEPKVDKQTKTGAILFLNESQPTADSVSAYRKCSSWGGKGEEMEHARGSSCHKEHVQPSGGKVKSQALDSSTIHCGAACMVSIHFKTKPNPKFTPLCIVYFNPSDVLNGTEWWHRFYKNISSTWSSSTENSDLVS